MMRYMVSAKLEIKQIEYRNVLYWYVKDKILECVEKKDKLKKSRWKTLALELISNKDKNLANKIYTINQYR